MFSHVQFSTRVIFGFAILLSNHVFCQPCRHFRVDKFSWFSSLALSSLLESPSLFSCTASLLLAEMFNPGRCPLLTAPKIPALWHRSLGSHCSTDSFISTLSVRRFTATNIEFYTVCWHDSLLLVDRHHHWLSTLPPGDSLSRQSHRRSQHRHHPHHRPSCILRAPNPSETYASSIVNIVIPLITSVGSSASTLRSVASKDSEHHHRVEHHFTPPTRSSSSASSPARERPFLPLPSHRPHPRPTLFFIRRDSRTFPRTITRHWYKELWTHWTLHSLFILCFVIYTCISRKHDLCIYLSCNVSSF